MNNEDDKDSDLPEKKEGESEKDEQDDSPLEPEVLDKLPSDVRKMVEPFLLRAFSGSFPVFNPIYKKITEGHINKVLDQTEKDSERDFKLEQSGRWFTLARILIFVAVFIFITMYLVNIDKELYKDVLKVVVGFIGGVGTGYGYKAYRDRNED